MANFAAPYATLPPNNVPWVPWPTNLPKCAETWNEESQDLRVRTEMSMGPPKTRRRYSLPMRKISVTMDIASYDLVEFRAFYEGSGVSGSGGTEGGYKFFTFTNPYDGLVHYYRFFSPPKFTSRGPVRIGVSMVWEEL